MSKVRNITVLESLFFRTGKPPSGIGLQQSGKKVTAQLPLTQKGIIKAAKKPYFEVGLEATLIQPNKGLVLANYATKLDIGRAYQNGNEMEDPVFDLPDPFMDALGVINERIEVSGDSGLANSDDLISLGKPVITLAELKAIKDWIKVADGLDVDAEELLDRINASRVSLDEFIKEAKLNLGI